MQKQPGTERKDSAHITSQPGSTQAQDGQAREHEKPRADTPTPATQNPNERQTPPDRQSTERG
jgi:hypothetical protein